MAEAAISSILALGRKLLHPIKNWTLASSSSTSSFPKDGASGMADELEYLMKLLEKIKATLQDAEEREISDEFVKIWLRDLKEVAYATDDILDEYQYEVMRARVEGKDVSNRNPLKRKEVMESVNNESFCRISVPAGMTDKIRKLINRFDEIAKDRDALQLREEDGTRQFNSTGYIPPTTHLVNESCVFGREMEKEAVVHLLLANQTNKRPYGDGGIGTRQINSNIIKVIPIVGKGGLGKTTLSQLVYNDRRVQEQFDKLGWLCVSDDFDVKRLIRAMVESVTGTSCSLVELDALQNKLMKEIKGARVLFVLDDVWNEQPTLWNMLKAPFMAAKKACFIVTTRNEPVARIMKTLDQPFYLGCLKEEHSWHLFEHYAYGGVYHNAQSNLVRIGRKIMKRCGSLPLALKSIASLLRYETSEEAWSNILESHLWELHPNDGTLGALQISYLRLPAYLKPCFLFASLFPKDFILERNHLVRLWIAQGYVQSKGLRTLEDTGADYFNELIQRSLFDRSFSDNTCKMHDIIHDLACLISKEYCAVEFGQQMDFPNDVHHLYAKGDVDLCLVSDENIGALRTLLCNFNHDKYQQCNPLSKTNCLRILELHGSGAIDLTSLVSNLKHLRYLSMASNVYMNPKALFHLYHLQVLILDEVHEMKELPETIGYLVNLRYLSIINTGISKLPDSICFLSHLQGLRIVDDRIRLARISQMPKCLGNLTNLRELTVHASKVELLPESICKLQYLRILDLRCCYILKKFPHGIENLRNLHTLILTETKYEYAPIGKENFPTIRKMHGQVLVRSIGWLKHMTNLTGMLEIEGLINIISLEDARKANLKTKQNLETLKITWSKYSSFGTPKTLCLSLVPHKDGQLRDEMDILILEHLQPHPNLKSLHINGFRGITLPRWMGDTLACSSLQLIQIQECPHLYSIPFGNLSSLKILDINRCCDLESLSEEALPPQLEILYVANCHSLIWMPGLQNAKSLSKLVLNHCQNLLLCQKPCLPLDSDQLQLTSLKLVEIIKCPKLMLTELEFLFPKSCKFFVDK